jgi:hypothetical protein
MVTRRVTRAVASRTILGLDVMPGRDIEAAREVVGRILFAVGVAGDLECSTRARSRPGVNEIKAAAD